LGRCPSPLPTGPLILSFLPTFQRPDSPSLFSFSLAQLVARPACPALAPGPAAQQLA
jgi:hypothetical protein